MKIIYIDNRLSFDYRVTQLYKRAGEKMHARTRVFKYMNISQRKSIVNAFLMSQLSYFRLIWIFHFRTMKHRKIYYPNQIELTFKELLEKSKTFSIHQRNLQTLPT